MTIALFLVVALVSGCAAPPPRQSTPAPQSVTSPSPTTRTATPIAPTIPPDIRSSERWIEVDLAAQKVRLREGSQVLAEYPASSGVATTPETTTYPGEYQVQQMIEGPIENVPGVFVSDILIFDLAAGTGIHSMPRDRDGRVLDSRLGEPVTAGCDRVGESAAVFRFARVGMIIWVH